MEFDNVYMKDYLHTYNTTFPVVQKKVQISKIVIQPIMDSTIPSNNSLPHNQCIHM